MRSKSCRGDIKFQIDTQCCSLGEDVTDLPFDLGIERHTTIVELVGFRKFGIFGH